MECSIENLHEICRVCLRQKGEVHLQNNFIELENFPDIHRMDNGVLTILELFHIFTNKEGNFLELVDEVPLICEECLKDLTYCYMFYNRLKKARIHMQQLYQDSLNSPDHYIAEEEYLVPKEEEADERGLIENEIDEIEQECQLKIDAESTTNTLLIPSKSEGKTNIYVGIKQEEEFSANSILSDKDCSIDKESNNNISDNFSVVIPHFVPANYNAGSTELTGSPTSSRKLMTIECQKIELTGLKQLQSIASLEVNYDNPAGQDDTLYMCKYCPQAFSTFSYLKNHLQKSHICKFCTEAFTINTDLFRHVRQMHTEHKCVFCKKKLSSNSNVRSHIKRVHGIKLPAELVLLDFIEKPNAYKDNVVYSDYLRKHFDYVDNAPHNNENT